MMQLSADTENRILKDYMFMEFLAAFKEIFDLEKFKSEKEYIRYQWSDDIYAKFMNQLIRMLEPRKEEKNVVLINENEEWSEVFFFVIGVFTIGFEINKKKYYVLKYNNTKVGTEPISFQHRQVIGALGVTFDKRAKFNYKTLTTCEGYTIRKKNWKVLLKDNPEMAQELEKKIQADYDRFIDGRMEKAKRVVIKRLKKRSDISSISTTIPIKKQLTQDQKKDSMSEQMDQLHSLLEKHKLIRS